MGGSARRRLCWSRPAAEHLYSGMVPGWLEGRYRREELTFDVERLTRAAGARLRLGKAAGIDPARREVRLEDGSRLQYDVLSIAIGARPAGFDRVDSAEVIAVKPIDAAERLTRRVDELAAAAPKGEPGADLAVAGTGAAGVELALTARTRLGPDARIVLLGGDGPIGGRSGWPERELRRALEDRAVTCRLGSVAARVEGGRVEADRRHGTDSRLDDMGHRTGRAGALSRSGTGGERGGLSPGRSLPAFSLRCTNLRGGRCRRGGRGPRPAPGRRRRRAGRAGAGGESGQRFGPWSSAALSPAALVALHCERGGRQRHRDLRSFGAPRAVGHVAEGSDRPTIHAPVPESPRVPERACRTFES